MMTPLTAARQAGTLHGVQDQREPTLDEQAETNFAIDMRMARSDMKLSQAALAQELEQRYGIKLDATAITRMERRVHDPDNARAIRLGEAVAIAEVLDLSLNDLRKPDLATQMKNAEADLGRNRRRGHRIQAEIEHTEDAYLGVVKVWANEEGDTDLTEEIERIFQEAEQLERSIRDHRSKLINNQSKGGGQRILKKLDELRDHLNRNRIRKRNIIRELTWDSYLDKEFPYREDARALAIGAEIMPEKDGTDGDS